VGGLLLAAGLGVNSNFLAFAGAAAIAAVLLAAVGLNINNKISQGASNV
jgi:AAHS family benzoate transporter-like MFS transporter